jgi:hypothetical protein
MDEMTELRRMRAAVPVLEPEELAGSMDLPWRVPERETGSRTRRSRRLNGPLRWRAGTAVALGLAAAVIASVVMVPHARPRHPQAQGHQQGGQTVALSARQTLLAAARRAEAQAVSPASGYWRERTIDGTAWQVGPATNRYVVEERVEHQVWQRRTPRGGFQETVSVRSLGAHPQTAADVAAWRRDGSPARWVVTFPGSGPEGTTVPMTRVLRARPSAPVIKTYSIPCLAAPGEPVPKHGTCGRIELAYRLPADPAKLARALAGGELARDPEGATGALFLLAGGQILSDAGPLMGKPVTPETRAAVFRAIAGLPGVRSLGAMRDPLGRQGVAIATTTRREQGTGELERLLIVDPATARLLAVEDVAQTASTSSQWARPGSPVTWTAFAHAGWTAQAPEHAG